jgi:hypothetical protein
MSENPKTITDDLISNEACQVLDNLNSIIDSSSSIASLSNSSGNNKSASDYLNAAKALKLNILNKKSKSFKKMSSSSNLNNKDPSSIKSSNSFQVKTAPTNNQNETFLINKENKFKSNSYLIKNNDNYDSNENELSSYENYNNNNNNNTNTKNDEFVNLFSTNHQSNHHNLHHSTISGITNSNKLLSNVNINILPSTSSASLLNKKKRSSLFNIFSFNRNSTTNSNSQTNKPIINTNNKIANLSMMNISNSDTNTNIDSNVSLEPSCKTFTRKRNLSGATTLENNNNNLDNQSKREDAIETTKSDLDWHKSFRNLISINSNNSSSSTQKTHRTLSSSNLTNNSSKREKQPHKKERFNSLIIPNSSGKSKHVNMNNEYDDVDFETCSTSSNQNNITKYSASFKSTSNSSEVNVNKKPSIRSKGFSIPLNASFCLNPVPVHCLNNYTINNESLFNIDKNDDNLVSNDHDKDYIETNVNTNEHKSDDNSTNLIEDQITASIVDINSFDLKESDHSCLKEFNLRLMKNKLNDNEEKTKTSHNLQEIDLDNDDLSCSSNSSSKNSNNINNKQV